MTRMKIDRSLVNVVSQNEIRAPTCVAFGNNLLLVLACELSRTVRWLNDEDHKG
jgi:hypothetical protein